MVSLWPFKVNETASFERTLSAISEKISRSNVRKHNLTTRSRRLKVLWTIYSSFALLCYVLIAILVTGSNNWGLIEYGVMCGAPLLIYLVRQLVNSYYKHRLSTTDTHLKDLYAQREEAIDKFKKATKYDTTQQLLEKYGAVSTEQPNVGKFSLPTDTKDASGDTSASHHQMKMSLRTKLAPPATANIHRPAALNDAQPSMMSSATQISSPFDTQEQLRSTQISGKSDSKKQQSGPILGLNAPMRLGQYPNANFASSKWYDRIIDLLLGEDETRPINRLALICSNCRLVNGQAPPGVRRLEEIGIWKCSDCGELNNQMKEIQNMTPHILDTISDVSANVLDNEVAPHSKRVENHAESLLDQPDDKREDKLPVISQRMA